MTPIRFAVLGNPVVDAVARTNQAKLDAEGLAPGDANLLPMPRMMELGSRIDVEVFQSGGAGANVAYTLGKLGHHTCFLGPLGTDPAGRHFFKEMVGVGLTLTTPREGYRTTELFVLVSPDGTRTMVQPQPQAPSNDDGWLDENLLQTADWLVVEGYVARDWPAATAAALEVARSRGMKMVLLLPAPHVCAQAASKLLTLMEQGINLVIGNEHEYAALLSRADAADRKRLEHIPHVITTSGGAATFYDGLGHDTTEPTRRIEAPLDNTGAGDAFAAGFLASYACGEPSEVALRRGHLLGGAVIQHLGPRLSDPMQVWLAGDNKVGEVS